ncbi:MAG: glycerophosphoryl diester phosphodiesterase [Candidatus Poriferisodalaceae bacterium]|jgi:glycerophosphoryl diester phosphodiesterase|tara:strand:- start:10683 stop:11450 length:768 start_codon:yes stop_codon:yes gene_type:complete
MNRHPYLSVKTPIPIAHRGGAGTWPENTMPAFQGAVSLGYQYVETDVHATSDGVLIAFHDDRLDRVTNSIGLVSELTWAEISSARVDGKEPIVRLSDLMSSFPELNINIDPKSTGAVEPLIKELRLGKALDRVCIGSFSDRRLKAFREAFGDAVCLSMGPFQILRMKLKSSGLPLSKFSAQCAQIPIRQGPISLATPKFIEECHELDIAVHVWTIDDEAEMIHLLDLNVDGIMTDLPQLLLDVLANRGDWPKERD